MGIVKIAAKSGLVALGWLWAAGALAQDNPEGGDEGAAAASASGTFGTGVAADTSGVTADTTAITDTSTSAEETPPSDDHGAVVGRLGVGFFGVQTVPSGNPGMPGAALDLDAPTVGVRYWLSSELGIEAAVGLAIDSTGTDAPGPGEASSSGFGFALHGGVPLALASSGHFVFEVVPQLNFGIGSRSNEVVAGMMTITDEASGLLFELGAMAGAEVHFGFIDLPDLALQGGVGFMLRMESRSVTPAAAMGMATDTSALSIGTLRGQDPWEFFIGNIAAIYYL